MLSVETALHLLVNVRCGRLSVNGLLAALERIAPTLEEEIFARVLDRAQLDHLEAVRQGKRPPITCPRCSGRAWVKRGCRPRRLKTSRGQFRFPLRQVTCTGCGGTWSPFLGALGLRRWQRVSEELLDRLVGLATDLSYGKSSRWGGELLAGTLAPMTIWRGVQQKAKELRLRPGGFEPSVLVLDGTRVPAGPRERGEALNLAFELGPRFRENGRRRRQKRLVGLAIGPGSWPRALPTGLDPELVVSDGGLGIAEAVADRYPAARTQRCEWHLAHSLDHFLWLDGLSKPARDPLTSELGGLLFGPAPGGARRSTIARWARDRLERYPQSRTLVGGALEEICYPEGSDVRTTSHAERAMRELNRRTDIGVQWSVPGVRHLLRLRLARRYNPDDYARLWPHRLERETVGVEVSVH